MHPFYYIKQAANTQVRADPHDRRNKCSGGHEQGHDWGMVRPVARTRQAQRTLVHHGHYPTPARTRGPTRAPRKATSQPSNCTRPSAYTAT